MASFTVGPLKSVLPLLLLLLLVVVCPVPTSARLLPKRPHKLTFYLQETPSTVNYLTNSTLGSFSVLGQPLMTEGVLPTSKVIGMEHGYLAQVGSGRDAVYAGLEFKIDQLDNFKGTFLVQGVFNLSNPVRTLVIVGGTEDFYLARGHVTFSTAASNRALDTATLKYEAHFKF